MTQERLVQRAILDELQTGALDALMEVQTAFERAAQYAADSDDPAYAEAVTLERIAAGIDRVWRDACVNVNADREAAKR